MPVIRKPPPIDRYFWRRFAYAVVDVLEPGVLDFDTARVQHESRAPSEAGPNISHYALAPAHGSLPTARR